MFFKNADETLSDIQEKINKALTEKNNILEKNDILTANEILHIRNLNFQIYGYYQDIAYNKWEKNNRNFILALQNTLLEQCNVDDNTKISDIACVSFTNNQQDDTACFELYNQTYVINRHMLWKFANKYRYNMGIDTISIDVC